MNSYCVWPDGTVHTVEDAVHVRHLGDEFVVVRARTPEAARFLVRHPNVREGARLLARLVPQPRGHDQHLQGLHHLGLCTDGLATDVYAGREVDVSLGPESYLPYHKADITGMLVTLYRQGVLSVLSERYTGTLMGADGEALPIHPKNLPGED